MATQIQTKEIRVYSNVFEIRQNKEGKREIEGYALEWDNLSEEMGWWITYREQFKKGAFKRYLADKETDTKLLFGHDINKVLARSKYSTIELKEDNIGLWFKADLPNNTLGNDTIESVDRKDIDGVSVGFIMKKEEWDETDRDNPIRTVLEADLPEISLTAFPAYQSSSVDTRENDPYKIYKDQINKKEAYNKRNKFLREVSLNDFD
jgi:hypothetical protein